MNNVVFCNVTAKKIVRSGFKQFTNELNESAIGNRVYSASVNTCVYRDKYQFLAIFCFELAIIVLSKVNLLVEVSNFKCNWPSM